MGMIRSWQWLAMTLVGNGNKRVRILGEVYITPVALVAIQIVSTQKRPTSH